MMKYVDAGFLIGLVDPGDAMHRTCVNLSAWTDDRLLLTDLVWTEAVDHFSSSRYRVKAARLLDGFRQLPYVELVSVDMNLLLRGFDLFVARPDKGWSLTDCVSFTLMRERGVVEALAYDHHFEQAGFVALMRGEG